MSQFHEFNRMTPGGETVRFVLNAAHIITVELEAGSLAGFAWVVMTDNVKFFITDYEAVRDWLLGLAHD